MSTQRELLKKALDELYLIHDTTGVRSADLCEEIEAELAKPEKKPCGECHLAIGERCDICGATEGK